MAPIGDELKAKLEEKKERLKTRVEEVRGKLEARRGSSFKNPQIKILAEMKEKGPVPAIRDRMERRRARRIAREHAPPETEVEPKLKRITEPQFR